MAKINVSKLVAHCLEQLKATGQLGEFNYQQLQVAKAEQLERIAVSLEKLALSAQK